MLRPVIAPLHRPISHLHVMYRQPVHKWYVSHRMQTPPQDHPVGTATGKGKTPRNREQSTTGACSHGLLACLRVLCASLCQPVVCGVCFVFLFVFVLLLCVGAAEYKIGTCSSIPVITGSPPRWIFPHCSNNNVDMAIFSDATCTTYVGGAGELVKHGTHKTQTHNIWLNECECECELLLECDMLLTSCLCAPAFSFSPLFVILAQDLSKPQAKPKLGQEQHAQHSRSKPGSGSAVVSSSGTKKNNTATAIAASPMMILGAMAMGAVLI